MNILLLLLIRQRDFQGSVIFPSTLDIDARFHSLRNAHSNMVDISGTPRCCNQCRRRRVMVRDIHNSDYSDIGVSLKCDLQQPSCARCIKRGIQCRGPKQGLTFVDRDATNSPSDRGGSRRSPPGCNQLNSVTRLQPLIPPTSSLDSSQPFYRCMVDEFKTGIFDRSINPSPQALESIAAICSGVIAPLAFRSKALDASVFVCFTMYLARYRGDAKLLELATSSYPTALREFRSQITTTLGNGSKRSGRIDMLMAISVALQFFEVRNIPNARIERQRRRWYG
jgi:hypothetical protein